MHERRHHYERAFEAYLRDRKIPYVSVNDARKALLPTGATLRLGSGDGSPQRTLKSFDFVIYGAHENLLIEVKGRKIARAARRSARQRTRRRLECWVTREDLDSLRTWSSLFGEGFGAAFCFCYWCEEQPPDGLFQELVVHEDRWYAIRAIRLEDYLSRAKVRSPRWGTWDLSARDFEELSQPLAPPRLFSEGRTLDPGPEVPAFEPLGTP